MDNYINDFMYIYMYELENFLNTYDIKSSDLNRQSDEANTDRQSKILLKNIILYKLNSIKDSKLVCASVNGRKIDINLLKKISIINVQTQEELTNKDKERIKENKKSTVYTNPDLYLTLYFNGKLYFESIEVKSTKNDKIPGSSVQQIDPNEWTIFILDNGKNVEFSTSIYINAIDKRIQFPDRSPRPEISYSEVKKWNKTYRCINNNEILYEEDNSIAEKNKLLIDWQMSLANDWINIIFKDKKSNNNPWFHNALRKFIILFIEKYSKLSTEDKIKLEKRIKENISD